MPPQIQPCCMPFIEEMRGLVGRDFYYKEVLVCDCGTRLEYLGDGVWNLDDELNPANVNMN
jgi:hypothetical protein